MTFTWPALSRRKWMLSQVREQVSGAQSVHAAASRHTSCASEVPRLFSAHKALYSLHSYRIRIVVDISVLLSDCGMFNFNDRSPHNT
jgi:hypothetical protein